MNCNLCEVEQVKGKIRSRKMLTQRELAIGTFMRDVYLPSLENYIYHIHYVQILSKNHCGTTLKECLRTLILKYNLIILATEEVFRSKDV